MLQLLFCQSVMEDEVILSRVGAQLGRHISGKRNVKQVFRILVGRFGINGIRINT